MCALGEDPWDVSDGEVINHREDVEKVELPQRERGSGRGCKAPQSKTIEAIITLVKISATSGQPGQDCQTMASSLW